MPQFGLIYKFYTYLRKLFEKEDTIVTAGTFDIEEVAHTFILELNKKFLV